MALSEDYSHLLKNNSATYSVETFVTYEELCYM